MSDIELPVVGQGATMRVGSDSYPGTVISVKPKVVVIQEDKWKAAPGYDYYSNQVYTYEPNPKGSLHTYTLRKNGRWVPKGSGLYQPGCGVSFKGRCYYQDPSF